MIREELLAKIDWIGETKNAENGTATPLGVAVLASLNALRAVVELHKPQKFEYNDEEVEVCGHCQLGVVGDTYPCETIQAIEKELV